MSKSNFLGSFSPPSSSVIPSIASTLSSSLKNADRTKPPPVIDLHAVEFRELARYIVQSGKFRSPLGHIANLLSFSLFPSEWPAPGLPSLRKAAGDASKSAVCGKVWHEDTLAYKCKTCERDPTCVICAECFREGNHTGHDYSVLRTSGGCCDCGDPQAWRPEGFCRHHPGTSSENFDPSASIDPILKRNIMVAVQAVAERLLSMFLDGQQQEEKWHEDVDLASELIKWLIQVAECGDGFRRLISKCVTDPSEWPPTLIVVRQTRVDMTKVSWLRVMLSLEGLSRISVSLKHILHMLYFQLITSLSFKRTFLELLILNYESYLHAKLLRGARSHPEDEYGFGEHANADIAEVFAVQLFTVPALVPMMTQEGGLLDILLDIIMNLFETFASPVQPYGIHVPYELSKFSYEANRHNRLANDTVRVSNTSNSSIERGRLPLPLTFCADVRAASTGSVAPNCNVEGNRGPPRRINRRNLRSQEVRLQQNPIRDGRDVSPNGYRPSEVETSSEGREQPNRGTNQDSGESHGHPENDRAAFVQRVSSAMRRAHDAMDHEADSSGDSRSSSMDDEVDMEVQHDQMDLGVQFTNPGLGEGAEDPDIAVEEPGHHEGRRSSWELDEIAQADPEEQLRIFEAGMHAPSQQSGTVPSSDFRSRENGSYGLYTHRSEVQSRLKRLFGLPPGASSRKRLRVMRMARLWGESAISGPGPLSHTLRLDLPLGERRLCETMSWRVIHDLKYVLTHPAAAFHLVHVRKDLFRKFVRLLSMAQGMNPSSRKFGDHVSMEAESADRSMTIELELSYCVELLSDAFCGINLPTETAEYAEKIDLARSRLECIRIVRDCLDEWLEREEALEARSLYRYEIFSVAHSVSIHLPLHRLLAFMMHHVIRQDGVSVRDALYGGSANVNEGEVRRLVRHPLRISSFLAQVRAGMWKRNGGSPQTQVAFYFNSLTADWFLDLDLFIQQCCAAVLGPRIFTEEVEIAFRIRDLELCLMAFSSEHTEVDAGKVPLTAQSVGLHPLAPESYARNNFNASSVMRDCGNTFTSLKEYIPTLIEDFFLLVVRVASERAKCGLAEGQVLRRKILHQLCCGDHTHSQLSRVVSSSFTRSLEASSEDRDSWEKWNALVRSIIEEIGEYIAPRGMEQGRYKLKTEMWREYDPFEPHLSAEDRNAAFVRHKNTRSRLGAARQVIPSDNANERPLFPQLRQLRDLSSFAASCGGVATKLLRAYCTTATGSNVMEDSLPAALHLVCMAVEKCNASECDQPFWSDYDPHANKDSATAFGSIMHLYKRCATADITHLSDVAPTMRRIIYQAIMRVNSNLYPSVAEFLRKRGEEWGIIRTNPGNASPSGNADPSAKMRVDAKRKQLLMRRKLQQKAALTQMRQQQRLFADFINSSEDGKAISGSRSPPASVSGRDMTVSENLGGTKVSMALHDSESSRDPSVPPARTSLCETHECVLCHGSGGEGEDSLMGLIGFHQTSRLPLISREQCQNSCEDTEQGRGVHMVRAQAGMELPDKAWGSTQAQASGRFRRGARNSSGHQPDDGQTNDKHENIAALQRSAILNSELLRNGVENPHSRHLSFCGHAVHIRCFDRYFRTLVNTRDNDRIYEGHNVVDLDRMEFLCPVCRRVANVVFPLVAEHLSEDCPEEAASGNKKGGTLFYDEWLQRCDRDVQERPVVNNCEEMGLSSYSDHGLNEAEINSNRRNASSLALSHGQLLAAVPQTGLASANGVLRREEIILRRFNLHSMSARANAGTYPLPGRRDGRSTLSPHSLLTSVAITTAACAEIACRTLPWNGYESNAYRKSVRLVLRKITAHTREMPLLAQDALRILWKATRSPDSARDLDPFAVFAFLFLLWPEMRLTKELSHLVRLGLQLIWAPERYPSSRNPMELTYDALLYLRQCSILISVSFEKLATPPISSYQRSETKYEFATKEIADILKYLGIPNVSQLGLPISQEVTRDLSPSPLLRFRPKRTSLIKLPELFQTVLESVRGRECESCGQSPSPQRSILCLVCGAMLCTEPATCFLSRPGRHAAECGGGVGVFLIAMLTDVIVIREGRSSTWGSPYLDAHGEEDEGLRRGKPLYLNEARYSALEKLWLTNSFDQDPRLLRRALPNWLPPM
eukprot:GFKZ01014737.1.p1 GENE.GFKZ01014737.1~~GFKZ01014737.1.p1  ORF type:complete len:2119 (-),score=181.58 GFKZ01014737.1:352-6708(-)